MAENYLHLTFLSSSDCLLVPPTGQIKQKAEGKYVCLYALYRNRVERRRVESGSEGTMGNIQKTSLPLPLGFLTVFYFMGNSWYLQHRLILMGIGRPDIAHNRTVMWLFCICKLILIILLTWMRKGFAGTIATYQIPGTTLICFSNYTTTGTTAVIISVIL